MVRACTSSPSPRSHIYAPVAATFDLHNGSICSLNKKAQKVIRLQFWTAGAMLASRAVCLCRSLAKARLRKGRGSSATSTWLCSQASACALLELSPEVTQVTLSCPEGLHTLPPAGSGRMPRNWPYGGPAALLDATTRQRGGSRGLGTSTVTMAEGALNTGLCPERLRCHNSWSVEAW